MTVVEFASWPVADNWNVPLEPSLKTVREVDGCTNLLMGTAEEDSQTAQLVVVWESIEHHQALINASNYPEVVGGIKASLPAGTDLESLKMYHVDFSTHARSPAEADLNPALTAKVTEKVIITLNEGTTKEDMIKILNEIRDNVKTDSAVIGGINTPAIWGQTVEDPNVFFLLIGWDSSKLHFDTVGQKKYDAVLGSLRASADVQMVHIAFN